LELLKHDEENLVMGTKIDGSKISCMVIDDVPFMIKTVSKLLDKFGMHVVQTSVNGVDAVEKYKMLKGRLDLITLDITMPEMDGLQVLEKIMNFDKSQRVVMISALGNKEKVKTAVQLGAKYFIVKPFKAEDVFRILSMVLKKY
jgi:two-component system, chemotaxis family, chemotaxis protein CheY